MQIPLATTFLAHAKVRAAWPEESELEGLLRRAYDGARAAWPGVDLPPERFARHLAERLPESARGAALDAVLGQLSLGELYLACACAEGVPAAIASFEREYLARLPQRLAYLREPDDLIDDVCQKVRELLLLPSRDGAPPGLGAYAGRGHLLSWVRVAAARVARRRAASGRVSVPEALAGVPAGGLDPELELIRRRSEQEFGVCLRAAVAALSADEQHLLRLHHAHGLSTVAMARLFGVSQPTMSRRLQAARQAVLGETRRQLKERLDFSSSDLQSFLGTLDSRLDLSISQIFDTG